MLQTQFTFKCYSTTRSVLTYHMFRLGGVRAKVYLRASPHMVDGQEFLKLEDLKMDFSVKDIQMGIRNVHNGNAVLGQYH